MMDRLYKRVAAIEAKQPKPRQITDDDRERWYQSQYTLGNLQVVDDVVIVNPALETTPLHAKVLSSVASAANQAKSGERYA